MNKASPSRGTLLWTGVFAFAMTAVVSGLWAGLLVANLASSPAVPWAAAVMAVALWGLWSYLGGRGAPSRTRESRHVYLRGGRLPSRVTAWALIAGGLWIVALAGFWIVLHEVVATPGNRLPDFSRLPAATVAASLIIASISGAVSEEAGFRGYFQGSLERRGLGPAAILVSALVMAPEHALTQGFAWPTMVFYLLVDCMLGALAFVTKSIRPGIVVHAAGLLVFFTLVWPHDAGRALISQRGADAWFWMHVSQTLVFATLAIMALVHLARLVAGQPAPVPSASAGGSELLASDSAT